jgi:predicted neuraminidase
MSTARFIRNWAARWCVEWVALCSFVSVARAESVSIEKVFGPETPTGKYKHPATITELDDGGLLIAWYGGEGEYAGDSRVFGTRRASGKRHWSRPEVLASSPAYAMGNPVLWQAPDRTLWLFFVVRPGATWSTSRIAAKTSTDRGRSWSDSFQITWEPGTMIRSRPISLRDGAYLLPIYRETGADTERTAPDTCSVFLRYEPATRQWTQSNPVFSRLGNLQAGVAELSDGRLLALCRRGGDYEPGDDGFVVRTESVDGGRTWTPGTETSFPNPNAAVDLLRLRNGHLLFLWNDSANDRTPLRAAISTDDGQSWSRQRNLAEGPGDFAYPTAIQTRDGRIHVTYTSDERAVIRHAVFAESWITGDSGK